MTSNCYVVYDEDTRKCIVIDPGSEKSVREIDFIEGHQLTLDFIIITHEHTDHNWGVNSLRNHFRNSKLLCSEECSLHVNNANKAYFLLYYDDANYRYEIAKADKIVGDGECMEWSSHIIKYVSTPGHSFGSICINIDDWLFTGDSIMPFKPYFNGRDSNKDDWAKSIIKVKKMFPSTTIVYPGHGNQLSLQEWFKYYL